MTTRIHTFKPIKGFFRLASAMRGELTTRFPLAFMPKGEMKKPLKIGIHKDIHEMAPDLDLDQLAVALRDYTTGMKYLASLKAGAERLDLEGHVCGLVTDEEAALAARQLKRARSKRRHIEVPMKGIAA